MPSRASPKSNQEILNQMRILFDQGTPVPLRDHLPGHIIETAFELGWSTLENGALLAAAEGSFELLITNGSKTALSAEPRRKEAHYSRTHDHKLASYSKEYSRNPERHRPLNAWRTR
jgi:hypothetical protein